MSNPCDLDFEQFSLLNSLSEDNPILFRNVNLLDVLRNDIGLRLARSLRAGLSPECFATEGNLASEYDSRLNQCLNTCGEDSKKLINYLASSRVARRTPKKKIFLLQSTKLKRVADLLGSKDDIVSFSNKRNFTKRSTWAPVFSTPDLLSSYRNSGNFVPKIKDLLKGKVQFLEEDWTFFEHDVVEGIYSINRAYRSLQTYRPDLLIVGGDNFLPAVAFVLVAKNLQIPTFCLQHGLDCERFFHEQIYSDYFCAWGEARAERCRKNSRFQPKEIFITGCPEFDDIRPIWSQPGNLGNWLWLTRPHEPVKCCEPSRYPDEGPAIFKALLEALIFFDAEQLVVKAHPRDDIRPYKALVDQFQLAGRVLFVEGRGGVNELIEQAGVVFSEDSTSGMEAMFFGKPVIHTHFSEAPPSLPFVEYGAALPGFNADNIKSSLHALRSGNLDLQKNLKAGQRKFLQDYAGPLDGHSLARVLDAIEKVI